MPTIIILSNESADRDSTVVLSEDIQPEHLASEHHAAQVVERAGWAVAEAKEGEDIGAGR